ncbi:hypothetical protein H5410_002404 [Solanum commersonii]|uniref:DUF4283 domain-containing protein n=1 Tax=Solanum commersonii TaxID=4109 RepID=A0A9J6B2R5_SOLCO|nr:hypothetical protein H5410_002404 [Solanum commersonii]
MTLIEYVLGDTPFEKCMDNYILYHLDGYYVFRFALEADIEKVMQDGPYTYHNKPFMLRNWEASFIFDTKSSAVGKPLYTDQYTIEMNHISYARVLVEVDISQPLLEIFTVDTHHGSY